MVNDPALLPVNPVAHTTNDHIASVCSDETHSALCRTWCVKPEQAEAHGCQKDANEE